MALGSGPRSSSAAPGQPRQAPSPLEPLLPCLENGYVTPAPQDNLRIKQGHGCEAAATVPDIVGTPKLGASRTHPGLFTSCWVPPLGPSPGPTSLRGLPSSTICSRPVCPRPVHNPTPPTLLTRNLLDTWLSHALPAPPSPPTVYLRISTPRERAARLLPHHRPHCLPRESHEDSPSSRQAQRARAPSKGQAKCRRIGLQGLRSPGPLCRMAPLGQLSLKLWATSTPSPSPLKPKACSCSGPTFPRKTARAVGQLTREVKAQLHFSPAV